MWPYNVDGGLQDNGSVRGPSSKRGGGRIVFEDWQTVGGGDGFYNVVDTVTNRYLYNESQFGSISRTDLYTGEVEEHHVTATRRSASTGTRRSWSPRTTATSSITRRTSC